MRVSNYRRAFWVVVLLIAQQAFAQAAQSSAGGATAEQALDAAAALVQKGQFSEAATLTRKAVALAPKAEADRGATQNSNSGDAR